MANKTSCSAYKTTLIDPNAFDGQSSASNISVPIEDLNISVELSTIKKARTLLTTNKEGKSTGDSSGEVRVNFIEGSIVGGKKVLTTKYTDLTTNFDDNNNEALGITGIDIDFNSSYAPMITISFIDVRGSAIFQNEENTANDKNKYSVFFQLPYPLYELTVKGYYGQPVKYCLHMTKFTSKFNSQTGNFEIIASFVGYNYAMLSDMLLGYLKAIEYTKLGKDKYEKDFAGVITLNQLYKSISEINTNVPKLLATDPNSIQLSKGDESINNLTNIQNIILFLGQDIDINKGLETYNMFIVDTANNLNISNNITNYQTKMNDSISLYNSNVESNFKLDGTVFTGLTNINYYKGLTISELENFDDVLYTKLKSGNSSDSDVETLRKRILDYLEANNYTLSKKQKFDVYDNKSKYDLIEKKKTDIKVQSEKLKKDLSQTLRENLKESLGFDPTIRNIINVFTTAVEVFMFVLFKVSQEADSSDNKRNDELKRIFKNVDTYDIKSSDSNITIGNNTLPPKFYPWPDYREEKDDSLVETYLGKAPSINPTNVAELRFIDDLLKAFLTQGVEAENAELLIQELTQNWMPINPLDTRLFTNLFPYKRISGSNRNEILTLTMLRAITFLGQTNKTLTPDEIKSMANFEADALLVDIKDSLILQSLTQLVTDDYLKADGNINNESLPIIKDKGTTYEYNYIFKNDVVDVLPINSGFTGEWSVDLLNESATDGELFLTNYTTTQPINNVGVSLNKPEDGGVYIKIIDSETYKGVTAYPLNNKPSISDITIDFEKIKVGDVTNFNSEGVGFNPFGGLYGTQEFSSINFGGDLGTQPYMYMFYSDGNFGDFTYNKSNGLGLKRRVSGLDGKTPTTSKFDITGPTTLAAKNIFEYLETVDYTPNKDNSKILHKEFGKNRMLASKYLGANQDITYPYINFNVKYGNAFNGGGSTNNELAAVSLFGSRLYNEQKTNHAKALLFLHSFPWTGLITDREYRMFLFGINNNTIFDKNEIINTFGQRGGMVSTPKIWAAFIGGLLWRADETESIFDEQSGIQIDGGSGMFDPIVFYNSITNESFIPTFNDDTSTTSYPNRKQYLTSSPFGSAQSQVDYDSPNSSMIFRNDTNSFEYKPLDNLLLSLPIQVKKEFKRIFFEFVGSTTNKSDWMNVKTQFELFDNTTNDWKTTWDAFMNDKANLYGDKGVYHLNVDNIKNTYNNIDNYAIITRIYGDTTEKFSVTSDFNYNFLLENKDDTQAVKTLMDLFTKEVFIVNTTYKIWQGNNSTNQNVREPILVKKDDLKLYFDTISSKINNNKDAMSAESKKKQQEQALFGTSDENIIKLMLYRTCKNIYDKWIGGSTDGDNVIFQCGSRNASDLELANKRGFKSPKLIDSFRFVTRSFKDIGDTLAINPIPVADYLRNNPNSSFYDCVTNLLSSNNFDFVPLPSFIDYKNPDLVASVFEPLSHHEAETVTDSLCGPTFVCVYLGQKSKDLDIGDSNYSNDGFDVRCQNGALVGLPKDFNEASQPGEDAVTFFNVAFGQQNQNIFKDITLDQSEFGETAESLQITDDISKKGSETNRTLAGQNIYNVYAVRSYKVEIEMLGNAMIQPMMYFQLNNIPLFHGAYMITRVKHSVKPNHMSTHFTGVRLRKPETQIFTSGDLYMSLLDGIDNSNIKKSSSKATFGDTNSGGNVVPNSKNIDELKNKINVSNFNNYTAVKYTQYGK